MQMVYWWVIIGFLFLLIEIIIPGLFFFISLAIGCGAGSIGALLQLSVLQQYLLAVATTIGSLIVLSILFANKKQAVFSSNIDALIGQTAIVTHTIEPHKAGYVKINGEEWAAISCNKKHLEKNTLVTILAVTGNKLIVNNI